MCTVAAGVIVTVGGSKIKKCCRHKLQSQNCGGGWRWCRRGSARAMSDEREWPSHEWSWEGVMVRDDASTPKIKGHAVIALFREVNHNDRDVIV